MRYFAVLIGILLLTGCLKKSSESESKGLVKTKSELSESKVSKDPKDPFRPYGLEALMKNGSDRGETIDIDWRRSVKIVPDSLAKTYFSDYDPKRELVIANVKEYDHFYVARFKKDAIARVILNKERLFEKLAIHHTGLRFVLKAGEFFELLPQRLETNLKPKAYRSLSFGIFALGAPGKYFGPKNSVKGDLVSAYMFFTPPEQSYRARELPINYSMDEILLDRISNPGAGYRLFHHLSEQGTKRGYEEIYGMFLNNCVHRLLALIRGALPTYRSDGVIDKLLNATYEANVLPTGLLNGFSGVIKNELERAGAVSAKTSWQQFWEVPDLVAFLDHLNCDDYKDLKAVRLKCAEIYSKQPAIIPDNIKQQQNYLVDKCISRNKISCGVN